MQVPTIPKNQAHQVSRLGETPAEARARMAAGGGADSPQSETRPAAADTGAPTPQHIAAMRDQEGFGGGHPANGTVEDAPDMAEPPTPSKAMEVIQQLSQDKNQLRAELDAALNKVARYEAKYGELD